MRITLLLVCPKHIQLTKSSSQLIYLPALLVSDENDSHTRGATNSLPHSARAGGQGPGRRGPVRVRHGKALGRVKDAASLPDARGEWPAQAQAVPGAAAAAGGERQRVL